MGFRLIDGTARSAWLSATSQQAQLEALAAAFPGNVTLRYYTAAGTHLRTVTHSPLAINTATTPRQAAVGALIADTPVTPDTATYVIAATAPSGGTDILRADIAPMTIVTGSRPNLQPQTGAAGLVVQADAGLPAVDLPLPAETALFGDSLTTHLLGYNWSPIFWANGLNGGPLQIVANAGIAGNTVGDMLARVDNAYTNATPGLAGLGTLGRIIFRGGTNDARAGASAASLAAGYTTLLQAAKSYCSKVVILSVPPIGPSEAGYAAKNALTQDYNAWLSAYAAANSSDFIFVDASANLRDGSGAQMAGYFQADGIHHDGRAAWREGVDAATLLASDLAGYASLLSTDPADVYPAQPQWVPNHVISGAGPTATGWSIGGYGSGFAVGTSIVAADGADPNQTPWQRVTPTAIGYAGMGEAVLITSAMSGRPVTATDPVAFDIMLELRFNAFDASKFKWARINVYSVSDSQPITHDLDLKMGGETITHESVVLRHAMPRSTLNNEAGGVFLWFELATRSAYTGSMGSFDFRCLTVRG